MTVSKLMAGAAVLAFMSFGTAAFADNSDIQGVESAKLSLSDAIMAAQKQDNGKAIFAKYYTHDGAGTYEVTVVKPDGKKTAVNVDPKTGQTTKASVSNAGDESQSGAQTIEKSKVSLTQAINKAEASGGKAMRATLDTENGKTAYKVELANGDQTDTVWIDANSGAVINKAS